MAALAPLHLLAARRLLTLEAVEAVATQAAPLEQAALAAAETAAPTQQLLTAPLTVAAVAVAVDTLAARLAWQAETAAPVS